MKEKALEYVARQMGISCAKAAEITGLVNEEVTDVLNGELPAETPVLMAGLEQQENLLDVQIIAERLHIQRDEISSWIERRNGLHFLRTEYCAFAGMWWSSSTESPRQSMISLFFTPFATN